MAAAAAAALRRSPLRNIAAHLAGNHRFLHHHQPRRYIPSISTFSSGAASSSSFLLRFKLPSTPSPSLARSFSSSSSCPGGSSRVTKFSGVGARRWWSSSAGLSGGGGGGAPLGLFLAGWRARASADPQFPFKVLMEQLVGVTACVLGDMATRPNFGLNELDFVFSTLVVGSILNFVLMYLLAPTSSSGAAAALPGIFAGCPPGFMFEAGAYSVAARLGTFVYKGVTFAAVGFAAGLAGTAITNGLVALRTRMDPEFRSPNEPPPTLLNAMTWSLHMGLSSNLRYQALNGTEFLLAKALRAAAFRLTVVGLRCFNNVLGGVSFVLLARLTGSQKVATATATAKATEEKKET